MSKMIKIGVFYDGNYFLHVSNYYNYDHPRQRRLSITGLHKFIKHSQDMSCNYILSKQKIIRFGTLV